jgi:hypothetical protein
MRYFIIFIIFIFAGCSTKAPINRWQYQSVSSYKSFESYYLQNYLDLASSELQNARSYASQSSDLTTLARIELSYCALRVAMLETFSCPKYDELKGIINSKELNAYESFLSKKLKKDEIKYLPKQYRELAHIQIKTNKQNINQNIASIKPLTSKMIAASLERENIDINIIDTIIKDASFHGYKYALIQWLEFKSQISNNQKTDKILDILRSSTKQ